MKSVPQILVIILALLKLTHIIDINWLIVASPILFIILGYITFFLILTAIFIFNRPYYDKLFRKYVGRDFDDLYNE